MLLPRPQGIKAVTLNLIGYFEELRRMILKTGCYVYNKQFCSVVCMMSMMLNSHGLVLWVQKVFSLFFLIPDGLRRGLFALKCSGNDVWFGIVALSGNV